MERLVKKKGSTKTATAMTLEPSIRLWLRAVELKVSELMEKKKKPGFEYGGSPF